MNEDPPVILEQILMTFINDTKYTNVKQSE